MSKRRASTEASTSVPSKRRHEGDGDSYHEDTDMDLSQRRDFELDTVNEADIGIIERISVKNFMCHNRLDIRLGPHVNFIIGRNGSGKSAVLTALVVGLGGKASVTNRGSTVKSFIKVGKQTAELQIKLRNRGPEAYKPDEFGDSIIVERKFSSDGGGQYRLKSSEGKVISQKREDLTTILDQFNIQVDNPVAILNQDTSRNFLNSKSPHDKYKFFLRATQLDQMVSDYRLADEQIKVTKDIIERKELILPKLEKEVLDWEQKFKALDCLDNLQEKVRKLKNEMAWSCVIEKEKGLNPLLKDQRQEEARLPKFVQKVTEAKDNLDQLVKKHKAIQDQLTATAEEVNVLKPQYEEAKSTLLEKKKISRNAQNELKKVETTLKNCTKERNHLMSRIKELKQSQDYQNLRTQEDKTRRRLQTLQGARSDRLKSFGTYVPTLLQHIEEHFRRGDFHFKPRGPVGACFKLKDSNWALAIERCLSGLIQSYCCHDHHDEAILEKILDRVCPPKQRPSIIVSRFKRSVESILLIADGREAREVMDPELKPGPPPNCREEDIAKLEDTLRSLQHELEHLCQQKSTIQAEIHKNKIEEKRTETRLMKIGQELSKLTCDLNDLKLIEDPKPVDVTTLEEEVENLSDQIQTHEQQRGVKLTTYQQSQDELSEDELGHADVEIAQAKSHKKHYEQKLKEQEKKIQELKKNVEQYQKEIESDVEKAKQICPVRVNTRRTVQNLESEINQINKQIKTEEKSRGNPEEITRTYNEKKDSYRKIRKEASQCKAFIKDLEKLIIQRQQRYSEFRLRGITVVQPTTTNGEGAKDMKSLSGGERSFSTVCFILSLWDSMESPFRCLDEFDVFMDMVNRRISMDMMMLMAKQQTHKHKLGIQIPNLNIFRMPDPDRGQGVLPFEPVNASREEEEE
ncbi:hypothetical protein KUTeg_011176 [Tegillarca granosa]|uniref:Rad50/SbcC-type AAA domain-containing protein n=1 Tax=Tegillarca granosa TaxID=220873 RepID=A0ABQ9F1K4_TEGGR|nr:hypothetical protein KUTeg_011176 [Tegillarca granosa]